MRNGEKQTTNVQKPNMIVVPSFTVKSTQLISSLDFPMLPSSGGKETGALLCFCYMSQLKMSNDL